MTPMNPETTKALTVGGLHHLKAQADVALSKSYSSPQQI